MGICLSQCLARQIDYQHYLLERETRRFENYKKREQRNLQKQQLAASIALPSNNAINVKNEKSQIILAIEASKRQYILEQRRGGLSEKEQKKEKRKKEINEKKIKKPEMDKCPKMYPQRILKQSDFFANAP